MMPAASSHNGTGCAPFIEPTAASITLGSVLIVGSTIMVLPMILNMCRTKSSSGVSCMTLVLTILLAAANAGSTTIIKWQQISACRNDGIGCLAQLLDLIQMFASGIVWLATLVTLCQLSPHSQRRHTALAALMGVMMLATWAGCSALSSAQPCTTGAIAFAKSLATAGSAVGACQYLPQLAETIRVRGSGSLSYATYILSVVGSAAIVFNQAIFNGDPWGVWLPLAVALVIQLAVLICATAFDLRSRQLRRTATRSLTGAPIDTRESLEAPLNRAT